MSEQITSKQVDRDRTLAALRDAVKAVEKNEKCGIVLILVSIERETEDFPHVYSAVGRPAAGFVMKALAQRCHGLGRTLDHDAPAFGWDPSKMPHEAEA